MQQVTTLEQAIAIARAVAVVQGVRSMLLSDMLGPSDVDSPSAEVVQFIAKLETISGDLRAMLPEPIGDAIGHV